MESPITEVLDDPSFSDIGPQDPDDNKSLLSDLTQPDPEPAKFARVTLPDALKVVKAPLDAVDEPIAVPSIFPPFISAVVIVDNSDALRL